MSEINAKEYWDNRYKVGGTSGYGSYDDQLKKKIDWLTGLNIRSVSEIGCGDFNFGKTLMTRYEGIPYVGQDISEFVINRNRRCFPPHKFVADVNDVPPADLLLCIDVVFHVLDDKDYEELLKNLENRYTRYFAITAYERDEVLGNHVVIRKFDYKRFGTPIIREVVEEDGQLYFYLFKKDPIDLSQVSCCLNTKEKEYPHQILDHLSQFGFGEVLINVDSDSPHRKHEVFANAKFDLIYYQDDDAICPVKQLAELSDPSMINLAMKPEHYKQYKDLKLTMGLGWGSIFPKKLLESLKKYTDKYGEDEVYKRETERIFTYLNYPQNRFVLPIEDLPSAFAQDRLWRQPKHYDYIPIVEERCASL